MTDDGHTRAAYRISGRVQGVGFRWWTRRTALELGLSGSVTNRRDGTVEVLVSGPSPRVERFRSRLERGPAGARVERLVELDHSSLPLPEGDFRITH